jgi:hypothetical protein
MSCEGKHDSLLTLIEAAKYIHRTPKTLSTKAFRLRHGLYPIKIKGEVHFEQSNLNKYNEYLMTP